MSKPAVDGNDVLTQLKELLAPLEKKIDKLTDRFDDIEKRFNDIEGKTSANEKRISENAENVESLNNQVKDCVKSCTFVSGSYDEVQLSLKRVENRCKDLASENVLLKSKLDGLSNEMEQERSLRNQDAQYLRTSVNVKLCGLPLQAGEDERSATPSNPVTREIVNHVREAAQINIDKSDIDVCHRLGTDLRSPIIIRFISKSARYSFFSQRKKLTNVSTMDLNYTDLPTADSKNAATQERSGRARGCGGLHGSGFSGSQVSLYSVNQMVNMTFICKNI